MISLTAHRYYDLKYKIIHLLSKGEVDMSATTAGLGEGTSGNSISDAEVVDMLDTNTEVEIVVIDQFKIIADRSISK